MYRRGLTLSPYLCGWGVGKRLIPLQCLSLDNLCGFKKDLRSIWTYWTVEKLWSSFFVILRGFLLCSWISRTTQAFLVQIFNCKNVNMDWMNTRLKNLELILAGNFPIVFNFLPAIRKKFPRIIHRRNTHTRQAPSLVRLLGNC